MILSIGYAGLSGPEELARVVRGLGAFLWDVRSQAWGRVRRGFSRDDLGALLGDRYAWKGDVLGGRGRGVTDAGIGLLRGLAEADGYPVILMCQEEAPGECHRHHAIARRLLSTGHTDVLHIYGDEVVRASALEVGILDPSPDADYAIETSLSALLESPSKLASIDVAVRG